MAAQKQYNLTAMFHDLEPSGQMITLSQIHLGVIAAVFSAARILEKEAEVRGYTVGGNKTAFDIRIKENVKATLTNLGRQITIAGLPFYKFEKFECGKDRDKQYQFDSAAVPVIIETVLRDDTLQATLGQFERLTELAISEAKEALCPHQHQSQAPTATAAAPANDAATIEADLKATNYILAKTILALFCPEAIELQNRVLEPAISTNYALKKALGTNFFTRQISVIENSKQRIGITPCLGISAQQYEAADKKSLIKAFSSIAETLAKNISQQLTIKPITELPNAQEIIIFQAELMKDRRPEGRIRDMGRGGCAVGRKNSQGWT